MMLGIKTGPEKSGDQAAVLSVAHRVSGCGADQKKALHKQG